MSQRALNYIRSKTVKIVITDKRRRQKISLCKLPSTHVAYITVVCNHTLSYCLSIRLSCLILTFWYACCTRTLINSSYTHVCLLLLACVMSSLLINEHCIVGLLYCTESASSTWNARKCTSDSLPGNCHGKGYATSAWWSFTSASERQRIEACWTSQMRTVSSWSTASYTTSRGRRWQIIWVCATQSRT